MSLLDSEKEIEKRTEFYFPINEDWLQEIGFTEMVSGTYISHTYDGKWVVSLYNTSHNMWLLERLTSTDWRNHRVSRLVRTREQLLKILSA